MADIKNVNLTEFDGETADYPKTSTDNVVDKSTGFSIDTILSGIQYCLADFIKNLYYYVPTFDASNVESIPENSNLDDYTATGTYRVGTGAIAATITNTPLSASGYKLLVLRTASDARISQIAIDIDNDIYVRNYYHGTWENWKKLVESEEKITNFVTRPVVTAKYTGVTKGTLPSIGTGGYPVAFADSQDKIIGGIRLYYNSSNFYIGLHNSWGGTAYGVGLFDTPSFSPYYQDNTIDLGAANNRWTQLYAGTATISTSDERLKDNISAIPDEVLDAWEEVNWYQFQFKDAIASKGEEARYHTGTIAQRIKDVFEQHDLDAFRYGLLCYDEWEDGNRYSLRYEEALCMEAAYQRRRADRLEARIQALEDIVCI